MLDFREEPFMTEALDSRATSRESSDEWSFLRGTRHCTVSFGAATHQVISTSVNSSGCSVQPGGMSSYPPSSHNLLPWRHNITSITSLSFIQIYSKLHFQTSPAQRYYNVPATSRSNRPIILHHRLSQDTFQALLHRRTINIF